MGRLLEAQEIHGEHSADKSDGAKYADGRKGLHGVQSVTRQCVKGNRITQCDGGHVECYADGIECKELPKFYRGACFKCIKSCGNHKSCRY